MVEVELTKGDFWRLGFWDIKKVVLFGDSSCFKL